jgi:hypothetical protein
MRRAGLGLISLLAVGLSGCFLIRTEGVGFWSNRGRSIGSAPGPDAVFMDVSIAEVPFGDRYANDELWNYADEQLQSIPPSLRKTLEENGLRIGLVSGRAPDGLNGMLTSKRTNREPMRSWRQSGNPATIALGPKPERCEFLLRSEGKSDLLVFEQALCQFQLLPTLEPEGKVRVQFTPQIEFQDPKKWSRLNPLVALNVQGVRSTEPLPALRWETALAPNEFLVIGAHFDRPKSLGYRFLVSLDPERPVQRLIVLRAGRFTSAFDLPSKPADQGKSSRTQPLAAQAIQ